ncbi:MAG TPA: gas vesicle protein GvpD [Burkholderiaceae bacterium]|nr:gas vesicle protein GvpD [Burkholderiaceae bacterium]
MIVYQKQKDAFLDDAFRRDIESVIFDAMKQRSGRAVGAAEVRSWRESLLCMAKVLNDDAIPADAGVAIEYSIPQTSKRIDFILSGRDEQGAERIVIVELKQWAEARRTDKDGIVVTRFAGGEQEVSHPSYQAWSYAALLEDFNDAVHGGGIRPKPCAYLHNYEPDGVIDDAFYARYVERAPLFLRGDAERDKLRAFIRRWVRTGDRGETIWRIEGGRIRPSKMLADSLVQMLDGKEEFFLIDDQKLVFETALAAARNAESGRKQVLIVEGGPGTGKTVLAINLLATLTQAGLVCRYVSKNAAPRAVYEAKLTGQMTATRIRNLFSGSGAFMKAEPDSWDVLIVDEAHRLNEKSGLYRNLGDHQAKEIITAAKCVVFFVDDDQRQSGQERGCGANARHDRQRRRRGAGGGRRQRRRRPD